MQKKTDPRRHIQHKADSRQIHSSDASSPKKLFTRTKSARQDKEEEVPLSKLKGRELQVALKTRFPRKQWKPGTMLAPTPVVMVSCGGGKSTYKPNIVTVAWVGTINSEPPMLSISIRPSRFSYEIISKTREFVVNIPTTALAKAVDWCGVKSGRDVDKFAETGLTPLPAENVGCPIIAECPIALECQVTKIIPLGTHDMFLAKIVGVSIAENAVDKKGHLALEKADVLGYAHGEYHGLNKRIGTFGFSVRKK